MNCQYLYVYFLAQSEYNVFEGDDRMTFSLRVSEDDAALIRKYAEMNGMSISDLLRQSVLEKIEDEIDLASWRQAYEEYLAHPEGAVTLDELGKELGLR
jgi:hypothetical protein